MATTLAPTNGHSNGHAELAMARQFDAPAIFGSRDEIKAVADRMRIMLPSARLQDWQLGEKYRAAAERNLEESLYRAAQLCVFYRLVPGEDVHLIPFNNGWAADMGIETWKKAADRYCSLHNITYHIHAIDMPVDELRVRRGDNYDPDDVGAIAYLWRSDKAQVYEIFGAEAAMTKGYGVWAKKARLDKVKNIWQPDTIPAQRTKQDVARRRAMKMALRAEFSLDSLLAANPQEERANLTTLEERVAAVEMDRSPMYRTESATEDGLFYTIPANGRGHTQEPSRPGIKIVVQPEPELEPEEDAPMPDYDDPFLDGDIASSNGDTPALGPTPKETQPQPAAAPRGGATCGADYRAIAAKLEGNAATLVDWAKAKHAESDGPATGAQYRYLAGVLDKITGVKDSHGDLLGILIGRAVTSANPPGIRLAKLLLDYVVEERTETVNGEKVKVANPQYRQDIADMLKAIWEAAAL